MNAFLAAVSIGAFGLAAVIVSLFAILTRHNRVSRRAVAVQATDPQLAQELRQLQSEMDRGKARLFY